MRIALVLCLALVAGAAQAADIRSLIDARNKSMSAAIATGNAAAVASFYTADALALPPNHDVLTGRAAIEAFWKATFESGVKGITLTASEAESHGDVAHEVGRYVVFVDGGKTADTGKYIVVWKREKGQWYLHRDIWNSSTAVPAPAPAEPVAAAPAAPAAAAVPSDQQQ